MEYDADTETDPLQWISRPEQERLDAVLRHHQTTRARAGNLRLHAAVHVTVETQLAEKHEAATTAYTRLRAQGLDRHDAIHALGSVVTTQFHRLLQGEPFDERAYAQALLALDADTWRQQGR